MKTIFTFSSSLQGKHRQWKAKSPSGEHENLFTWNLYLLENPVFNSVFYVMAILCANFIFIFIIIIIILVDNFEQWFLQNNGKQHGFVLLTGTQGPIWFDDDWSPRIPLWSGNNINWLVYIIIIITQPLVITVLPCRWKKNNWPLWPQTKTTKFPQNALNLKPSTLNLKPLISMLTKIKHTN